MIIVLSSRLVLRICRYRLGFKSLLKPRRWWKLLALINNTKLFLSILLCESNTLFWRLHISRLSYLRRMLINLRLKCTIFKLCLYFLQLTQIFLVINHSMQQIQLLISIMRLIIVWRIILLILDVQLIGNDFSVPLNNISNYFKKC